MSAFTENTPEVHASNRMDRAADILEEGIFLKLWIEFQERRIGLNGGYNALDLILNNQPVVTQPVGTTMAQRLDLIDKWSKRDAYVAASIIQWLGTKEGAIFIQEAEDRIKVKRKEMSEKWHKKYNLGLPVKGDVPVCY